MGEAVLTFVFLQKQLESEWSKEDDLFNSLRREIQARRTLVTHQVGAEKENVRLGSAPYYHGPSKKQPDRVGDSDRYLQESGSKRLVERGHSRDRESDRVGYSNRSSPGRDCR